MANMDLTIERACCGFPAAHRREKQRAVRSEVPAAVV